MSHRIRRLLVLLMAAGLHSAACGQTRGTPGGDEGPGDAAPLDPCTPERIRAGCCPPVVLPDLSGDPVSFSRDVVPIFQQQCAFSACHDATRPAAGLYLGSRSSEPAIPLTSELQQAYESLLAPATLAPTMARVSPGNPAASFLVHKLDGTQNCGSVECRPPPELVNLWGFEGCGKTAPWTDMPRLPLETRNIVRRWIAQGAALDLPCIDGPDSCEGSGGRCCDGYCVDLRSNAAHCGGCGLTCPASATCVDGACTCPERGAALCSTACVDLESDPDHCGACGTRCDAGSVCSSGACVLKGIFCVDTFCPDNGTAPACCTDDGRCGLELDLGEPVQGCLAATAAPVDLRCPMHQSLHDACCFEGTCGVRTSTFGGSVLMPGLASATCLRTPSPTAPACGADLDAGTADATPVDASTD